jgi:hypothetical protein
MYVYKPVACSISSLSWTPSGNTCKESTSDFQKNKTAIVSRVIMLQISKKCNIRQIIQEQNRQERSGTNQSQHETKKEQGQIAQEKMETKHSGSAERKQGAKHAEKKGDKTKKDWGIQAKSRD